MIVNCRFRIVFVLLIILLIVWLIVLLFWSRLNWFVKKTLWCWRRKFLRVWERIFWLWILISIRLLIVWRIILIWINIIRIVIALFLKLSIEKFFDETIFDVLIDEKIITVLINFIVNTITIVTISLIKFVRNKNSESSKNCDLSFVKQFDHRSLNDLEKNQSQSFYNSINDTLNRLKFSVEVYRARTIE